MSLIKEDWERIHLTDTVYLKCIELEEEQAFKFQRKPATIKVIINKNKHEKNSTLPF